MSTAAPVMPAVRPSRSGRLLPWAPVALLLVVAAAGVVVEAGVAFDPPWLLPPLNLVFLTIVPLVAAALAVEAYRRTGVGVILAIGAAMVATAAGAGIIPAVLLFGPGPNATVTVHNTSALVAAVGHLAAAIAGVLGISLGARRLRHVVLAYGVSLAIVGVVVGALLAGRTPPFWTADGPTAIRQLLLGSAAGMMLAAAFAWWQTAVRDRSITFLRWYVPGLVLFGVGLLAILTQDRVGGIVSWIGRSGQYVGAVWMLVAVAAYARPVREGGRGQATLGISLLQAALPFRPLVESTSDAVIAVGQHGTVVYWNEAAAALFRTDPGDAFDRDPVALLGATGTPAADELRARLDASRRGAVTGRLRLDLARADGSSFPAELSLFAAPEDDRLVVLVVADISERVRFQRELERRVAERTAALEDANEELQRANAAKDEFLGLVSHELRTPITSILAAAPILARRVGAADDDGLVEDIAAEATRLAAIVDNLLALARIEASVPQHTEPVSVEHVAARAVAEIERERPGARITVHPSPHGTVVEANEQHVLMLIRNLLENAVKYGPPGGEVEVTIAVGAQRARIDVRDHGAGFGGEDPETLFESFRRGAGTASKPGIGVGLAVVRRIVESLGGSVRATEAADGGAVFTVELPLAQDDETSTGDLR